MTTRPASDRSHDLLPWYANGTLGEDESRAFREHLRQCEACREEMDAIEQIRSELEQHGEALLEEHPTSERLVATVSGELKGPEAATVRRHIALCDACAREARWVTGDAVAGEEAPAPAGSSRGSRWRWALPAAAAALLFSIVVPLFWPERAATRVMGAGYIIATERAAGDDNRVHAIAGQDHLLLVFEVDLAPSDFPVMLSLVDAGGDEVVSIGPVQRELWFGEAYLFLECATRDCTPGTYTALVQPQGAGPGLRYNFEVLEP